MVILQVIQYALKIIIPFLGFRARLLHKYGKQKDASSATAAAFGKIYDLIGDSRMLWRFWGTCCTHSLSILAFIVLN